MTDIVITKKNESKLNLDCDQSILRELSDHFSFYADGYKFHPRYKAKQWNGIISLVDLRFGTLPCGLYDDLVAYAKDKEYTTSVISNEYGAPDDKDNVTVEELKEFTKSLNIHSKGNPIEVRDYQINSVYTCIRNQRQISINSTGSGKSIILFILYRWYQAKGMRALLVVPNLSLISQMKSDFIDYSTDNSGNFIFNILDELQVIADGASKEIDQNKSLVLATWQSVFRLPSQWYNGSGNNDIDVIMLDETHQYKADAMRGILEKSTEVKYRFGVTGSLDKSAVNKMTLRGMIGEISREKSTRDLIDEGFLSDIKINCALLKYNKETKKLLKEADYQTEISFIIQHEARNNFIRKLALSNIGTTLILFNHIEHGEKLYEEIKKYSTIHAVHYISGKIEADERESIRQSIQLSSENNILLGSIGTVSTGFNLPQIHHIIFAHPTKSVIRTLQSIGRGLRKAKGKDKLILWDIADIINTSKSNPNYTYNHFKERLKIYIEEDFPYKLLDIDIEH